MKNERSASRPRRSNCQSRYPSRLAFGARLGFTEGIGRPGKLDVENDFIVAGRGTLTTADVRDRKGHIVERRGIKRLEGGDEFIGGGGEIASKVVGDGLSEPLCQQVAQVDRFAYRPSNGR